MLNIWMADLYPAQREIRNSAARFKVLACGRRFGKTAVAIDLLCSRLLDGQSAAYFAPTYRMGAEAWRAVVERLYPLIRSAREEDWRMELRTGGVFEAWSLAQGSGELVRGRKYHFVVMDEAALFDSADVWHGAIRPLLTDYEGAALFCSTPKGRNWFWQLYLQGQSPDFPDWASWRYPTSANPYIKAAEIAAAKQEMPERIYLQEYEAVFLDDGGAVFRNVDKVCVGEPYAFAISDPGSRQACFFGVDWGKDYDFTAVSVMTRDGRQLWLERFHQIGWQVQRDRLMALYKRFQPNIILAEANSIGSVNIEALQGEGLPVRGFMTTAKSKTPLIDHLALAMEKGEVTLLDDATLKNELMAYEMRRTRQGWSYSAPPGLHDDTVIATALSYWAARRYGALSIDFV